MISIHLIFIIPIAIFIIVLCAILDYIISLVGEISVYVSFPSVISLGGRNSTVSFGILFLLLWFLKNILVSGCLVYPIQTTCINNLSYYDSDRTKQTIFVSEAWAKGWSDQKTPILEYKNYNENFNWFKTWRGGHLKKIFEKILPFLILVLVTLFYLLLRVFLKKKKI